MGDTVLYRDCIKAGGKAKPLQWQCDSALTTLLQQQLPATIPLTTGYTSDRPICTSTEKRYLGQTYSADVVDMEGFTVIEVLRQASIATAMLRVISDDCHHDLPNLSSAISSDGSLQPFPLFKEMLQHPLAAARLIRGSLQGLKVLQQTIATLFLEDAGLTTKPRQ